MDNADKTTVPDTAKFKLLLRGVTAALVPVKFVGGAPREQEPQAGNTGDPPTPVYTSVAKIDAHPGVVCPLRSAHAVAYNLAQPLPHYYERRIVRALCGRREKEGDVMSMPARVLRGQRHRQSLLIHRRAMSPLV